MKKLIAILLAAVICLSLVACGGNDNSPAENDTDNNLETTESTTANNINPDYVGEWKCSVRMVDPEKGEYYKTSTVTFRLDGSATLITTSGDKYDGTWEYREDSNRIILKNDVGNNVFQIAADGEKTVLKFYADTYYRANEFVAQ